MICNNCVTKLEEFDSFQHLCSEAEKMLQDFRSKLKHSANEAEGKVLKNLSPFQKL